MASKTYTTRPSLGSKKDEQYHKETALYYVGQNYQYADYQRILIDVAYSYFQGLQEGGTFDSMLKIWDQGAGYQVPFVNINFNKIRPKVELLLGDFINRGFRLDVRSINKSAKTDKMKKRASVSAEMALKPELEAAEGVGLSLQSTEVLPETEEDLDLLFEEYRSDKEIMMQDILRHSTEQYKYRDTRVKLFADMWIGGETHVFLDMRNGYPQPNYVRAGHAIVDRNCKDDYLTDAEFFGLTDYLTFPEIGERFNLDPTELETLRKDSSSSKYHGFQYKQNGNDYVAYPPFNSNYGQRALVKWVYWLDIKDVWAKITHDKHGNEHVHTTYEDGAKKPRLTTKEKSNPKNKIEKRTVQCVRYCIIAAGEIVLEWGEMKNQLRPTDNPQISLLPAVSYVPHLFNGTNVSKVMQLQQMQDFKNFLFVKVQQSIAKSPGNVIEIDTSTLPDHYGVGDQAIKKAIYWMQSVGVIFRNKGDIPDKTIGKADLSMTQNVSQFINLSLMIDAEMDSISGINEARQGQISPNQLKGVTESAVNQSSKMTESYFYGFKGFEERFFQKYAAQCKITWVANREKFSPIIGDLGYNLLAANMDLELDDYSTFIFQEPENPEDLRAFVMAGVEHGADMASSFDILDTAKYDYKLAIKKYKNEQKQKREAEMEHEQTVQAQNFEVAAAMEDAETQKEIALIQEKGEEARKTQAQKIAGETQRGRENIFAAFKKDSMQQETEMIKQVLNDAQNQKTDKREQ